MLSATKHYRTIEKQLLHQMPILQSILHTCRWIYITLHNFDRWLIKWYQFRFMRLILLLWLRGRRCRCLLLVHLLLGCRGSHKLGLRGRIDGRILLRWHRVGHACRRVNKTVNNYHHTTFIDHDYSPTRMFAIKFNKSLIIAFSLNLCVDRWYDIYFCWNMKLKSLLSIRMPFSFVFVFFIQYSKS